MSPIKKKIALGGALVVFLVGVLVYRTVAVQANRDAFAQTLSPLNPEQRSRIEQLVVAETKGMTRNEEKAVVYYHAANRT